MVSTCTQKGGYNGPSHSAYYIIIIIVCVFRETRNKKVSDGSLSGVPVLFIPGNAGSHRQGVCVPV